MSRQKEELAKVPAKLQSNVTFTIQPCPDKEAALAFARTWLRSRWGVNDCVADGRRRPSLSNVRTMFGVTLQVEQ